MKMQLYDEYGKSTFVEVPSDSRLIGLFKHEREDFGRKSKVLNHVYAVSDEGVFCVYPLRLNQTYVGWKVDECTNEYNKIAKWSKRNVTPLSDSDLDDFLTELILDGF
jgi:hypothetical protein